MQNRPKGVPQATTFWFERDTAVVKVAECFVSFAIQKKAFWFFGKKEHRRLRAAKNITRNNKNSD